MMRVLYPAALWLLCLLLAVTAEAVRTHDEFVRSTYYEPEGSATTLPQTTETKAEVVSDTFKNTEDSAESNEEEVTPEFSAVRNPESTQPSSASDTPQHYKDFRGASYDSTKEGDFKPDAKPWWFNPEYARYGYYPQQQQQEQNNGVLPSQYPLGYPTHFYNRQQHIPGVYSQTNPGGQYVFHGSNGQYSSPSKLAEQYSQAGRGGYQQYSGITPYELTGGGCPTQYWISNTQRWPAFLNVKSTIGDTLGTTAANVFGDTTLLQALLNTRTDGYSYLLRSGATAILNSYTRSQYRMPHIKVIDAFSSALVSSQAAAKQAAAFDDANMSDYVEQYNSCT